MVAIWRAGAIRGQGHADANTVEALKRVVSDEELGKSAIAAIKAIKARVDLQTNFRASSG